jgi:hypothetical protein
MTPHPKPAPRAPREPKPLKRRFWLSRGKRPKARKVTKGGRNTMPAKLAWLRESPCAICCGVRGLSEAHHERKGGARADDRKTIPLCAAHHRLPGLESREALGREGFERRHGVSLEGLCAEYQQRWEDRS